jgi:hypothetical protein
MEELYDMWKEDPHSVHKSWQGIERIIEGFASLSCNRFPYSILQESGSECAARHSKRTPAIAQV